MEHKDPLVFNQSRPNPSSTLAPAEFLVIHWFLHYAKTGFTVEEKGWGPTVQSGRNSF